MLASQSWEVRLGATDSTPPVARAEGWSRRRGIVTAVVVILVMAITLVLSRLDLANELDVVRSELTAANTEVDESEMELDQLEEQVDVLSQGIAACQTSAELGEQARAALADIQRGIDRGDQGAISQAVAEVLRIDAQWAEANAGCQEAAASGG